MIFVLSKKTYLEDPKSSAAQKLTHWVVTPGISSLWAAMNQNDHWRRRSEFFFASFDFGTNRPAQVA